MRYSPMWVPCAGKLGVFPLFRMPALGVVLAIEIVNPSPQ